jgi:hypothetical protein
VINSFSSIRCSLRLKGFELSVGETYVLSVREFISPHQMSALHDDPACGTKYLVTECDPHLACKQIEDVLAFIVVWISTGTATRPHETTPRAMGEPYALG